MSEEDKRGEGSYCEKARAYGPQSSDRVCQIGRVTKSSRRRPKERERERERDRDRKMGDGAVAGSRAYPIRCVAIGWDASCWGVPNLLQTLFSLSGTNPNGCRLDAMQ